MAIINIRWNDFLAVRYLFQVILRLPTLFRTIIEHGLNASAYSAASATSANSNANIQNSYGSVLDEANEIHLLSGTTTEIFEDASEIPMGDLPQHINQATETFEETSEALMSLQQEAVDTMETTLNSCQTLVESLLDMPFQHLSDSSLFSPDYINLLRITSHGYDRNRKRKHIGVFSGSASSMVGGALTIAGVALIPVTFGASIGLMVVGGATTAVGTGVNIGFTAEKAYKDRKRKKNIAPQLEEQEMQKYIKFEKDTATAVALIAIAFSKIENLRSRDEVTSTDLLCNVTAENIVDVQKIVEQGQTESSVLECLDRILQYIKSLIGRLYKIENSRCSHSHVSIFHVPHNQENVEEDPFTFLLPSLNALCDYLQEKSMYPTFAAYLQRKFQVNNGIVESFKNKSKSVKGSSLPRTVFGMRAVTFLGRILSPVFKYGDDVAKFGARAASAARVTSIAVGIVSSAAGMAIDSAFLVHAAYSLAKGKREEFFQHLVDIAQSMDEINQFVQREDNTSEMNKKL